MTCPALEDNTVTNLNNPDYSSIFSDDPIKIRTIGRILQKKFKMLINDLPNPRAHNSSAALDNIVTLLSNDLD